MKKTALAAGIAFAIIACFSGTAQADSERFYERKAEGWFWYEVEPEEIEEEIPQPIEPAPIPEPTPEKPKVTEAEPTIPAFSAEWFRVNLPKYKDIAWNNPTIENVQAYLYLQRYVIDRSEQFADTSQLAVIGDPFLDESTRRPGATFASDNLDRLAGTARDELLHSVASKAGVFFFYESNCAQCELQAPLIKNLETTNGFTVVPISVDGSELPDSPFDFYNIDAGHAKKLGVQTYPAIFLATPDGQFAPVGQGAFSLPELRQRILIASRRSNIISSEQFNRTRPVLNYENNIAEQLTLQQLSERLSNRSLQDKEGFVEPEILLNNIKRNLGAQ